MDEIKRITDQRIEEIRRKKNNMSSEALWFKDFGRIFKRAIERKARNEKNFMEALKNEYPNRYKELQERGFIRWE